MIIAKTFKGRGVSFAEGHDGWHGKPFSKADMPRAIAELEQQMVAVPATDVTRLIPKPGAAPVVRTTPAVPEPPAYKIGDQVATRKAYGVALAKLGKVDDRVVALDADVKNSTFSEEFEKAFPDRFYQNFIAEQVMVGSAMGLAARGAIPFPSTFACFLTRAADFIRMAAISGVPIKLAGSHAGVSIGEDGPSQMALEDLAMCRAQPNIAVLYPCDAVSTERLVTLMAYHPGPAYMRTSRPTTPVIYGPDEPFTIGGLKVLRQSAADVVTVVGAGVTVFEALDAHAQLQAEGVAIRVIACRRRGPHRGRQADRGAHHYRRRSLSGRRDRRRGRRGRVRSGHCRAAACRARDSAQRQARGTGGALRHLGQPHRGGREVAVGGATADVTP
jgi:transketolase